MTKFQQALQEELAGRLRAGKIRSTRDLSDMMTTMFWEAVREVLLVETDLQLSRQWASAGTGEAAIHGDMPGKIEFPERDIPKRRADISVLPEAQGRRPGEGRSASEIEAHVLSLYSHGMSLKDIENCIREFYGVEISKSAIARMTDWIGNYVGAWKNRGLEKVYLVVWVDTFVSKVRQDGRIVDRAILVVAGLNSRGQKEVLSIWSAPKSGPVPWIEVLKQLKARGVGDILLVSVEDDENFSEALRKVFLATRPPSGLAAGLRRATATIPSRDRKAVRQAVREICEAPDLEAGETLLEVFQQKWTGKYPLIAAAWEAKKEKKALFFELPVSIRKIIDSVDLADIISRAIPRHTHSKTIPANDQAAEEAVYMALMKDEKKWAGPLKDWPSILVLFIHIFGERTEPKQ